MTESHVPYAGDENLDIMALAHRYNEHQVELLQRCFGPRGRLLDFGSGSGTFSRLMRGRGYDIECLEIDDAYRRRLAVEGFATHAALEGVPAGSLDGVYLLNVLEHIEHDVEVLRDIRSRIRPGGRVFVYVPAFQVLYSAMDRSIGHWRRYTRHRLERTLREAGFRVRGSRYHDSVGYLASLAYKLVGSREGRIEPGQVTFYDRNVFPVSLALDPLIGAFIGKNVSSIGERES